MKKCKNAPFVRTHFVKLHAKLPENTVSGFAKRIFGQNFLQFFRVK